MKRKEYTMTKESETVRALRLCAEMFDCYADSTECPYAAAYDCEDELLNDAADLIESLQAQLAASQRRAQDARNELCQRCGRYKEAHKGACDGCRWKED